MRTILLSIAVLISTNTSAQELIKGIFYDMPKKEAKTYIDQNKELLKIEIGSAKFMAPGLFATDGLVKGIDFPEKTAMMQATDKAAATNRINDITTFFTAKGYEVINTNELTEANNAFGVSAANAVLMKNGDTYIGISYSVTAQGTAFKPAYSYTLFLRITTTAATPEMFKKIMLTPKPGTTNADSVF